MTRSVITLLCYLIFLKGSILAQTAPEAADSTFYINENDNNNGVSFGDFLGKVKAIDSDFDVLTFSIIDGNIGSAFEINSASGDITIDNNLALDFETTPVFTLKVSVSDDEIPARVDTALIIIRLMDVSPNDFCTQAITLTSDTAVIGSTNEATSDVAIAANCGSNLTDDGSLGVWYNILGNGETITLSTCDSSDYDTGIGVYTGSCISGLTCVAGNDDGNSCPNKESLISFNSVVNEEYLILIDGFRNNIGQFSLSVSSTPTPVPPSNDNCEDAIDLTVFESGIGTPVNDSTSNATAFTGNISCDPFANVNDIWYKFNSKKNTQVVISTALNSASSLGIALYKENCNGTEVACEDSVGNQNKIFSVSPHTDYYVQAYSDGGEGSFSIIINDGPNTIPDIPNDSIQISRYLLIKDTVAKITFSDVENHQQRFRLIGGNQESIFQIDSLSGAITILNDSILLTSSSVQFNLKLTINDQGPGELIDTANIFILVKDNTPPTIIDQQVEIDENTADSTFVYSIVASDPDEDSIVFKIIGNAQGVFTIDSLTGQITVEDMSFLNYESDSVLELTIEVTDNGPLSLSESATITIKLNDVNEPPVLTDSLHFSVSQNAKNGSTIGFATYTDEDGGQSHGFSITSGNTNDVFGIDSLNGELSLINETALVTNMTVSYTIGIVIIDNGNPAKSDSNDVTIDVVNNRPPMVSSGSFDINENATNNSIVGTISATDPDMDSLIYSFVSGNQSDIFNIDSSGAISIRDSSQLDFESQTFHKLLVKVQDNGAGTLSSSDTITVNVLNVNEAPIIKDTTSFSISYNSPNNFKLGKILGVDPENDSVKYLITAGNNDSIFAIDSISGEIIIINQSLLNPATTPKHTITVEVTDSQLSSSAFVEINIFGNESPELSTTTFGVLENSPASTLIGTLSSDDPDGIGSFEIISGNEDSIVSIGQSNGELRINDSTAFDFEITPVISLVVKITDLGPGMLQNIDTVQITIIDESDKKPLIMTVSDTSILELSELNLTISASDEDTPIDDLSYGIDMASLSIGMTINSSTGVFRWIPGESQNGNYNVVSSVYDGNSTDYDTFNISVIEVNESPVMNVIGNKETDELQTLSFTISAVDNDLPANELVFNIDQTSIDLGMTLDSTKGTFSWKPTEDQGGKTYPVTFVVSDGFEENQETINITVDNVNQKPEFHTLSDKEIDESSTLEFTALATDSDLPPNTLTYSIDKASQDLGMIINEANGNFSWKPTEIHGGKDYAVTITVSDGIVEEQDVINIGVNEINEAPVLVKIGNREVNEQETLSFNVSSMDNDLPKNTLSYSLDQTALDLGMMINDSTGVFNWTPEIKFKSSEEQLSAKFNVTITVSDGELFDSEQIQITVLKKQKLGQKPMLTVNEGLSLKQNGIAIINQSILSAEDQDNTAFEITYNITKAPAYGTLKKGGNNIAVKGTFTQSDIESEIISYTHNEGDSLSDDFSFVIMDSDSNSTEEFNFKIRANPLLTAAVGSDSFDNLILFPNPAMLELNMEYTSNYTGNVKLKIYGTNGKEYFNGRLTKRQNQIQ